MAEDCDPAVLHARVCVLEADNKRHDSEIGQLRVREYAKSMCRQPARDERRRFQIRIAVDQFKD